MESNSGLKDTENVRTLTFIGMFWLEVNGPNSAFLDDDELAWEHVEFDADWTLVDIDQPLALVG